MKTVSDIGERKLIDLARMIYHEHDESIDLTDDCAVLPIKDDTLLITTDMISEKTHIPKGMSPWQIGWFITAINLSDIAAKGGHPLGVLLSVGLPKTYPETSFLDLIKGATSCVTRYNTAIIGGDTKENDHIVITGTAIGKVKKEHFLPRNGIKPDDVVAVTGNLGKAAAGFYELKQKRSRGNINELCEPTPRIFEGVALAETGRVHSCMDISDGLSSSLYQLADLNNVGFHIQENLLPISPRLIAYAEKNSTLDALYLALHYGGDYELLFTAPSENISYLKKILKTFKTPLTVIGKVIEEHAVYIDRKEQNNTILPNLGYEHFTEK